MCITGIYDHSHQDPAPTCHYILNYFDERKIILSKGRKKKVIPRTMDAL